MVLEDDNLVDIIVNAKSMHLLRPFFEKPLSLSEACKLTGLTMTSYHYWITKYLKYNLLKVAYVKKRAGSSIRYYITPAKEILIKVKRESKVLEGFFRSYADRYNAPHLAAEVITQVAKDSGLELGVLITLDREDDYWTIPVMMSGSKIIAGITKELVKPQYPAVFVSARNLFFRTEDAKELQYRLVELLEEFDERVTNEGGKRYFIRVEMTPEPETDKNG